MGGAAIGLLLIVAAVAMILIPSGTAATNKTLYSTTINGTNYQGQPTALAASAGASTLFQLHLGNDATSPNQLGSANITPPAGFTITAVCAGFTITPCAPLPAGSTPGSTLVQLRNLNIAAGSAQNFAIQATAPCSGTGLQWSIYAKQSNGFSGPPGNNFFPYPLTFSQTLSDTCHLHFVNQPADTAVNVLITDLKNGGHLSTSDFITLDVLAGGQHLAGVSGQVTMVASGGAGCTFDNSGSTLTANFNAQGYAVFDTLKIAQLATNCVLTASSGTYGPATSGSFDVGQYGTYCPDPNNCSLPDSSDNQQFADSTAVTSVGAQDITLNYSSLSDLVSGTPCGNVVQEYTDKKGNTPTGLDVAFDPNLNNFQGIPGTTVTHTVNKHWVQTFPNNGNPFIDMCAGAVRVDRMSGVIIPCNQPQPSGLGGWITKDNTAAVCSGDGLYWGILGSFQQSFIPASDPKITGWTSDGFGNRIFTISLGTVAADQTWYFDWKVGP